MTEPTQADQDTGDAIADKWAASHFVGVEVAQALAAERARVVGEIRTWAKKNILWFMAGGQTELLAALDSIEKEKP